MKEDQPREDARLESLDLAPSPCLPYLYKVGIENRMIEDALLQRICFLSGLDSLLPLKMHLRANEFSSLEFLVV